MNKFNFGYSTNNITLPNEPQYKIKLVEKIEKVIKRMRWKAIFSKEKDSDTNSKDNFGLKSDKCPPPFKELQPFEDDLHKLVDKIKFKNINCEFQKMLKEDIKDIKHSKRTLTPADKTSNFYKMTPENYEKLLHNSITNTYKKANTNIDKRINEDGKKIANKKDVLDKIQINGKEECFITLKDHKINFENNPTTRLINPAKNEIGRISKVIIANINKKLRKSLKLQQWNSNSSVINWFNNIKQKNKHKFMIFDIKDFYPSITEDLLDNAIKFAQQHVSISKEDLKIIKHARKSLLYSNEIPWQKKNTNLFDVTMGAYDGAEVCELVGLFLLFQLSNKFDKNNIGLYRDDGLAIFKDINGHEADKIRKEFHQLFNKNGLSLEIDCNLKVVNYLDITFNLNNGTYKPFRKPNDETLYINAKSNHPQNIIKQLPISIESRLSNLSSNETIFHEASRHYQNILQQCGYNYKMKYQPPKANNNRVKNNRKRNIIWFNPPFSKNVVNNVGKYFLQLIPKHFPNNHKYHKLFNKNTLKISYSCMPNIKSIINNHNKKLLSTKNQETRKCNCINKQNCPLNNECLTKNIIYKGNITCNLQNYNYKTYYGTSEDTFKTRYANHKKSFNHIKYKNETELSNEFWRLKELNAEPKVTFSIFRRCPKTKRNGPCYLCLHEKLAILEHKEDNLLNTRNELVSKCRHKNKFKLANFKT